MTLTPLPAAKALETLKAWNAAVMTEVPFDPNVKDGRGTKGLRVPKSNWANPLDTAPYEAYAVTCGVERGQLCEIEAGRTRLRSSEPDRRAGRSTELPRRS